MHNESQLLAELKTFHFPRAYSPPADCIDYLTYKLRQDREIPWEHNISPEDDYQLVLVLHGFFGWLFSRPGSQWLLKLYGIHEVPPHHGFSYYFEDTVLGQETDSSIRIFTRSRHPAYEDPPYEIPGAVDDMKEFLRKVRGPEGKGSVQFPSMNWWHWGLIKLRDWFTDPADRDIPTPNPTRVNGKTWAAGLKDPESPTDLMWSAIEYTERYSPRAYRISQGGGVMWCGKSKIAAVPRNEHELFVESVKIRKGESNYSQEQAAEAVHRRYLCDSCGKIRPCNSDRRHGDERLCDYCYSTQLEGSQRPTLRNCTYRECGKAMCPNYLREEQDYINLKFRINSDASGRVER